MFTATGASLILHYQDERDYTRNYLLASFADNLDEPEHTVTLRKTFTFGFDQLLTGVEGFEENSEEIWAEFQLGKLVGEYYQVIPGVITRRIKLFFHPSVKLSRTHFIIDENISIFRIIEDLISEDIYVGGPHITAIS
ncbi:hypothetical protein [Chitinophaga sp. LS1]|uniref:hypothetical protein n=1 Tax=Chitinophaga sp. LS1 TaxID=3051176 RepID=UPI002AAC197A|nr:hypothetical protein [Chitinophaga sp. LS1]WPV64004.1 hypothetical protein QQL36_19575 [Chitinophaga sp. LS1]